MDENKKIVCRVCLTFDSVGRKYLSLFEKYKDNVLSEKINLFVSFTIQKNDGLPDKICPECVLELENALQFREKCEKSNQILQGANFNKNEDISYVVIKEEPEVYLDEPQEPFEEDLQVEEHASKDQVLIKKSRAIDLKLICHDCEGSFKSKCKLKVHWKKAHLPKFLFCERCKRQFKSFKAFNKHKEYGRKNCALAAEMRIEGTGKSRVFHCKLCDYNAKHFKNLKAHLVTHSGARPYQCNICSKGFSQISSLHGHKETAHNEYRVEATCQHCGKFIRGRSKFYKHIQTHQDAKVQCEHCKKMFKSRQTLKVHMMRHSGYKGYTCEICAANYYTSTDLINHKRMSHTTFAKNTCDICGYETKTYSSMFKHKKKHTDTNICCLLCGKFLSSEQDFTEHKKFHFGKKYPCPSCERTYNCRKSLLKHSMKVHTPDILSKPIAVKQTILIKKENPHYDN